MGANRGVPDRPSLVYRLAVNLDLAGNVTGGYIERYVDHELAECVVVALDFFGPFDGVEDAARALRAQVAHRWGLAAELPF